MYITVDPGLNGTGYAIWNKQWQLVTNNIITFTYGTIEERGYKYRVFFKGLRKEYSITKIFIEYPALFASNKGSVTAASGALVKLAWLTGLISGVFTRIELVSVTNWKGQLPKDVVIRRIKKILPSVNSKSHDWDAIGIGLYKKGVF